MSDPVKRPAEAAMESERQKRAVEVVCKSKLKPREAIGDPKLLNKPVISDSDDDDDLGDEGWGWSSDSDTPWVPPTTCFICHKDISDHIPVDCPKFPSIYPIKNCQCSICWMVDDHVAENCPVREDFKQMPDGSYVMFNPSTCKSSQDMSDDDFGF